MIRAIFLAVFFAVAPLRADQPDMRCGAYCLYVGLKALDVPVSDYAEIEGALGPPSLMGYSLGQLADVARKYGIDTLGVESTPENLARRPRPFVCIARFDGNHFVNIADIADGKAVIIGPPTMYEMPVDTLRTTWDGNALLLSRGPLIPEEELPRPMLGFRGISGIIGLCLFGGVILVWYRQRARGHV